MMTHRAVFLSIAMAVPAGLCSSKSARYCASELGAVISTAISTVAPGAVTARACEVGAFICSPLMNTSEYSLVHVQVPVFFTRHTLLNDSPAPRFVLSGMVTSVTNAALFVQSGELVGTVCVLPVWLV